MPSISDLPPELRLAIASHLASRDLTVCVRVSREWSSTFTPILYSNIYIAFDMFLHRFLSMETQSIARERQLLKNVQSIRTRFYSVLKPFLQQSNISSGDPVNSDPGQPSNPRYCWERLRSIEFPWECVYKDPAPPVQFLPPQPIMPVQGLETPFGSESGFGGGFGGSFGTIPAPVPPLLPQAPGESVIFFGSVIPKMTPMTPPTPCPTLVKDVPLEQYLISIFEHSPNLETLQLTDFMLSEERLVRTLTHYLKNLKVLDLKAEQGVRAPVRCLKILLENLPSTVEMLSLEYDLLSQEEEDADKVKEEDRNNGEGKPLLAVKLLVLYGDMAGHASALWIPFLRRCRNLESLSLQSLDSSLSNKSECLSSTLTDCCSSLHELILNHPSDSFRDTDLARLILAPPEGWRRIHITYSFNFGLLSSDAVVEKCGRLEHLAIEGSGGFGSRFLQRLLSKCKGLKSLEAITEGEIQVPNNVYLDARDIITSPWACQDTLQSLKVIISNIPRPDVKEGPGRWPLTGPLHDGTIQDGLELQRRVLAQIGRMSRLEYLWLGHDDQDQEGRGEDSYGLSLNGMLIYLDTGFQYSCLELSLSSQSDDSNCYGISGGSSSVGGGIELLEGLKELKDLDVRRMSHRIGQAEVEWMVKEWPKMTSVVGLRYGQEKWLKKHCPQIKVRS